MPATYNEIDPFAARWLRGLIAAGHIAPGVVDERSIEDLDAASVAGPGQRHFFAGIAGWSLALRLAGVPDDADVWTGSCPCQGFSDAGRRRGFDDERHLWPAWFQLIRECRPPVVFGEQVASNAGLLWLDAVFADLEGEGYACAAADLCAASVGAPHIRKRLFFVAYSDSERFGPRRTSGAMRDEKEQPARLREAGWLGDSNGKSSRWDGGAIPGAQAQDQRAMWSVADRSGDPGQDVGFWSNAEWMSCSDGQRRPVEPGTHPLAHGVPGRVGLLRGYGNAIVPQVAAAFIRAALEARSQVRPLEVA